MISRNYTDNNNKIQIFWLRDPVYLAEIIAWIQILLNGLTALLLILTLVGVIDVPAVNKDGDHIEPKERTIFVFRVLVCLLTVGLGVILLVGSTKFDRQRRSYLTTYAIFSLVLFLWNVFIASFGAGHVVLRIVQFVHLPVGAAGIAVAALLA